MTGQGIIIAVVLFIALHVAWCLWRIRVRARREKERYLMRLDYRRKEIMEGIEGASLADCEATDTRGFICCLDKGHPGPHVAEGCARAIRAVWVDDEAPTEKMQ